MSDQAIPRQGSSQRVTCSGFGTGVQAVGMKAKTIVVQARPAVTNTTGAGTSANADKVLVYVQTTTPGAAGGAATTFTGISLAPGDIITLCLEDSALLWFEGASGDSVNILCLL